MRHTGPDFWKNYMQRWFGPELIAKWEQYAQVEPIESAKGRINLEVYRNANPQSPTLVFTHGIAGYARILLPFLIPLYERGYNIVAPDLEGYGYNQRRKGDFTWDTHLQNIRDAVAYARQNSQGSVFLGGASMGGPLAYSADARYNCADGLICWCLWDFADREFMRKETTTKALTHPLLPFLRLGAHLFGRLRVKTYYTISYDTLTDSQEFNELVKRDPQAGTLISLRGVASLLTQSRSDLPHEQYTKPVLVLQPEDDRMTPPHYTKKTFELFQSPHKRYCSLPGPHFPLDSNIYEQWATCADEFIKQVTT